MKAGWLKRYQMENPCYLRIQKKDIYGNGKEVTAYGKKRLCRQQIRNEENSVKFEGITFLCSNTDICRI